MSPKKEMLIKKNNNKGRRNRCSKQGSILYSTTLVTISNTGLQLLSPSRLFKVKKLRVLHCIFNLCNTFLLNIDSRSFARK